MSNLQLSKIFPGLLICSALLFCFACTGDSTQNNNKSGKNTPAAPTGPNKLELTLRTGCGEQDGTSAKVYVQFVGENGKSPEFPLDNDPETDLKSCSQDKFVFDLGDQQLGNITGFSLWHDNSGEDPSYLVEIAYVKQLANDKRQGFPCGKWFSSDIKDGQLRREFFDWRECK